MNKLSIKNFIPGIAWFFVILILICLPGEDIPSPSGWWNWINLIHFDKLVHMGIFAVLTVLFILPISRSAYSPKLKWSLSLKITLAAIIWGLSTELIQKFFVPTRQFDLIDWTADSIGVLLGLAFCRIFLLNKAQKEIN